MAHWKIPDSMPRLDRWYSQPINRSTIPDGTTHVELITADTLYEGYIPPSVTHLDLGLAFNHPLQSGHIPNGVMRLDLGYMFNQPLQVGHIPPSVTHLVLSDNYDLVLEKGCIPDGVTHITFGMRYNQPLQPGSIPDSVTHLVFCGIFRHRLDPKHLSKNLKVIQCRYYDDIGFLSNVPSHIRIYVEPNHMFCTNFTLDNVPHCVYIQSGEFDQEIINNRINGIHYVDTVQEDGITYLFVHGDNYICTSKSARK